MHLSPLRVLSAAVIPLLFLTACGSDKTASPLDVITVGGTDTAPTLTFKTKPLTVKETTTKVITAGKGAKLTKTDSVTANAAIFNGKDGTEISSSFGKESGRLDLSEPKLPPGLSKGLTGQAIGSRLLIAIPPADAFGAQRKAGEAVGPTDTIVLLIDLISATTAPPKTTAPPENSAPSAKPGPPPPKTATGAAVPPKAGLPTVTVDATNSKAAQITIPKTAPPTTLIIQPLIKGKGPVVKSGQTITVHYTGVLWKDGKKFDASGDRGEPVDFPIGVGQVISGWDKGLVGQTVGSRILLVTPPADAYGAKGKAPIGPNETLVFVVDILAAA